MAMTTLEMQRLFDETLLGEYEDEAPWKAVRALHLDGSREVFDTAAAWLWSDDPLKRARGVDVLAQLRAAETEYSLGAEPKWLFREEAFHFVVKLIEGESSVMVLDSAIAALGHIGNGAGIPIIVRYKNHPDQNVRFSVACALGQFPDDLLSVTGLLALTGDGDSEVRDWAVFGLGVQGSVDTPEIREALLRCLGDADENVREEAAVGLGKRQDLRLLPVLRGMLEKPELKIRAAEAASALLGLPEDPEMWEADDYKRALNEKFGGPEQR